MNHRQDIQILRGVAVLMVVLFHLQVPLFENGYLGVDVFFVISGYLMATLYDKGSAIDFYKRRIDRLLPAYALTIVAVVAIGGVILIPSDFAQLKEQALAGTVFANNIHFWNQNSYFSKITFNPLLNLWSLAVEAQFYLIVPLIYPPLRKRKRLLALVFAVTLAACFLVQAVSPKTAFFLMPFRIWEFVAGAFVAWNGASIRDSTAQNSLFKSAVLPLLCVSALAIPLKPDSRDVILGHPGLLTLWLVLLSAAVIRFGLPKRFEDSLPGRLLAAVGDYSYSIYLTHFPIIVLWNYKEFGGTILAPSSAYRWLAIVASIALASGLSYAYVEKKYSALFKTTPRRIGLLALVFAVCLPLARINADRFDDSDRNIFASWTDRSPYRCGKLYPLIHPTRDVCLLGEQRTGENLLLVGDSHADSIKTSFSRVAAQFALNVYFIVTNDPLTGAQVNAAEIARAARLLDVKYIVIHFSNIYKNPRYRSQISELVQLAKNQAIKVIVLAPVPTYDTHVPQAMYRSKDGSGEGDSLSTDMSRHQKRTGDFNAFAAELAALGVSIYDPAPILCPDAGSCRFSDAQSHPYYYDSDHLTLTGAAQLEGLIRVALNELTR